MGFDRGRLPDPAAYYAALKLPGYHRSNDDQYRAVCPFHAAANNRNSLLLDVVKGSYKCFACGAYGRNVLDFEIARSGASFRDAAIQLGAWIDELPLTPPPEKAAVRPKAESADVQAAAQAEAEKAARTLAYCIKIWAEASPVVAGDAVARYLDSREIDLQHYPSALRTHPALRYREDGQTLGRWPAMLAAITNSDGNMIGLHRTYIDLPADLPRKKMLGKAIGGCVRLGELSRVRDARRGVAEGIETALSASIMFGPPVDSALSAAGLEAYPIDGCDELLIFGDLDENDRGRQAAHALALRALDAGLRVSTHYPTHKGEHDWNDVLIADRALESALRSP